MKNTGAFLDFIGQSMLILMLGLIGIGMTLIFFYVFAWPTVFTGVPIPFRIFSGFITGCMIVGMSIGVIRIIWYLWDEYKSRSS